MSPSRRDPEVVAEQAYLDAVYDRLEAMRVSASSVADAYNDVRRGGTHQARLERDIAVETTHRRLAALDIGDTPLCFGRLDLHRRLAVLRRAARGRRRRAHPARRRLARAGGGAVLPGDRGRADGRRPPSAHPHPPRAGGGRPRRRGLRHRGRGRHRSHGHGRGCAARRARPRAHRPDGRHRRHDPGRAGRSRARRPARRARSSPAVRAPARPRSRSTAPRTSSTRTGGSSAANGVLLIGPSPVFLRYIEQVLPSLGEDEVQLATVAGLKPGLGRLPPEAPRRGGGEGRRAHGRGAATRARRPPAPAPPGRRVRARRHAPAPASRASAAASRSGRGASGGRTTSADRSSSGWSSTGSSRSTATP